MIRVCKITQELLHEFYVSFAARRSEMEGSKCSARHAALDFTKAQDKRGYALCQAMLSVETVHAIVTEDIKARLTQSHIDRTFLLRL